ncbi:MAG TPA: M50 family metallopeptidase [Bryobacteraceae bacterium]|nr:M50 family metallopeptidase [Bryobacteraceae bacterium]
MSKTPILDREEAVPAVKVPLARSIFIGFALGVVFLVINEGVVHIPVPPVGALPIFLVAWYASLLMHELGHAGAGLAMGFEVRALVVGAFHLERRAHGWRFRLIPKRFLGGGLTSTLPQSNQNLVRRFALCIMAGPAVSAILFIITFFLPTGLWVGSFCLANLILAAFSCIPFTVRGQPADAKNILILAQKGVVADRLAAILYLLALDARGIQPREWPHEFVERMSAVTNDMSYLPLSLAMQHACLLETNDTERIAQVLESALSVSNKMPPDLQRGFFHVAACFQGMDRKNVSLAESWLASARGVKGAASLKDWDSMASAAICLAHGQPSQAREYLMRYKAFLDELPLSGMIAATRARVVSLLDELAGA